jgi:hypothetical protein
MGHPEALGQALGHRFRPGVARAMCAHFLTHAKGRGFRNMQFNFVVSTNGWAARLSQGFGFEIVGGTTPRSFPRPCTSVSGVARLAPLSSVVGLKSPSGRWGITRPLTPQRSRINMQLCRVEVRPRRSRRQPQAHCDRPPSHPSRSSAAKRDFLSCRLPDT